MDENFQLLLACVYNLLLLAGTAYVVFVLGASGWWFLLTLCLMASYKKDKE